jgi:hypothetical protein
LWLPHTNFSHETIRTVLHYNHDHHDPQDFFRTHQKIEAGTDPRLPTARVLLPLFGSVSQLFAYSPFAVHFFLFAYGLLPFFLRLFSTIKNRIGWHEIETNLLLNLPFEHDRLGLRLWTEV